jgi:hypothetical protein
MRTNLYARIVLFLLLTGSAAACGGCDRNSQFGPGERGSGTVTTEMRSFSGISGVNLATIGTLKIEVGGSEELVIETDDNLHQYIQTEMKGGTLVIRTSRNIRPSGKLRLLLKVKSITSVAASSSGDILLPALKQDHIELQTSSSGDISSGPLKVRQAAFRISSSGDITVHALTAEQLDVAISSSGDCRVEKGRVNEQRIMISSSGDYRAENLESGTAEVRSSSSGDARIRVTKSLDASTSSSGDIYYAGKPGRVRLNESSSGKIREI